MGEVTSIFASATASLRDAGKPKKKVQRNPAPDRSSFLSFRFESPNLDFWKHFCSPKTCPYTENGILQLLPWLFLPETNKIVI